MIMVTSISATPPIWRKSFRTLIPARKKVFRQFTSQRVNMLQGNWGNWNNRPLTQVCDVSILLLLLTDTAKYQLLLLFLLCDWLGLVHFIKKMVITGWYREGVGVCILLLHCSLSPIMLWKPRFISGWISVTHLPTSTSLHQNQKCGGWIWGEGGLCSSNFL